MPPSTSRRTEPALGITDPYELTQPQLDAAVALLKKQPSTISEVLGPVHRRDPALQATATRHRHSLAVPGQHAQAEHVPVAVVLPKEGVDRLGRHMDDARARHSTPTACSSGWRMRPTPEVQGKAAYTSADAGQPAGVCLPRQASPRLLHGLPRDRPGDFSQITFWKTPLPPCGDGRATLYGLLGMGAEMDRHRGVAPDA